MKMKYRGHNIDLIGVYNISTALSVYRRAQQRAHDTSPLQVVCYDPQHSKAPLINSHFKTEPKVNITVAEMGSGTEWNYVTTTILQVHSTLHETANA